MISYFGFESYYFILFVDFLGLTFGKGIVEMICFSFLMIGVLFGMI